MLVIALAAWCALIGAVWGWLSSREKWAEDEEWSLTKQYVPPIIVLVVICIIASMF